jgi:glutamyl-tRNA synthetase
MVKTRFAPSPTGQDIHIGNLHTALLNWVWAKKNKGKFIVRIEDTDQARLIEGAEERILKTLKDYGLNFDEQPYRQSERLEIYKKYAEELVQKKAAYYCDCSKERLDEVRKKQVAEGKIPKYDKHCFKNKNENIKKPYVIRLNVPENTEVVFNDLVRGEIKFKSNDIDDQVLLKSDGYPTYHLAVVVDDHLMEISHIIRGEDWISSTPKHVLLYQAFGWEAPVFVHTPILRNPDRSKLSKRKNPVWASWYLEQGYYSQAVLNYLSLMGWSHPKQLDKFSLDEFVKVFELKDLQAVGPVFDIKKLEWLNGEYIRETENEKLKSKIYEFYDKKYPENVIEKIVPLIKERIKKLSDYLPLCEFFFEKPKNYEVSFSDKKTLVSKIHDELEKINEWKADVIGNNMQKLAAREKVKSGDFFMSLRVVITGKKVSPPLNESMEILGKKECLDRIKSLL